MSGNKYDAKAPECFSKKPAGTVVWSSIEGIGTQVVITVRKAPDES